MIRWLLCIAGVVPFVAQAQTPSSPDSVFAQLLRAPQTNAVRDSLWDIVAQAPTAERDSLRALIRSRTTPLYTAEAPRKLTAGYMYFQDSNGEGHIRIREWAKHYDCDSAQVEVTLAKADTMDFSEWSPRQPRVGDTACVLLLARGVPYDTRRMSNVSGETEYWFYGSDGSGLNVRLVWNGRRWIITQTIE